MSSPFLPSSITGWKDSMNIWKGKDSKKGVLANSTKPNLKYHAPCRSVIILYLQKRTQKIQLQHLPWFECVTSLMNL